MLTGADVIEFARCVNGIKHYDGQAPDVDADRLGEVGEGYDILDGTQVYDIVTSSAITACQISRVGKDGRSRVFKLCSTFTAFCTLLYILYEHGFRRKEGFSYQELSQLVGFLRAGLWEDIAKLVRKKWQRPY